MRYNSNPMQRDVPPHDPEPDADQQFAEAIATELGNSTLNAFSRRLSGESEPEPEPSPEQRRADALREAYHALSNQQEQEGEQS